MTKIADIHTALSNLIEAQLSGYVRLPNPYSVDENTYLYLRNGYGLAVGSGRDTQRYVGCLVTWERVFTIILVNQITTTENNTGSRVLIEEELLNAHDKLRKAVWLSSTLAGTVIKSTILEDQGISFIDADRQKFLALEMNCYIEYQEDPNT